jgi:hypothetical protein
MKSDRSNSLQCADVRLLGNAQSHIAPSQRTTTHTVLAQCSLKALAGAVLDRTLPRTLSAHSEKKPRTLPAHSPATPHNESLHLDALVRAVAREYGFNDSELSEALEVARRDPAGAFTSYRAMAAELGVELVAT